VVLSRVLNAAAKQVRNDLHLRDILFTDYPVELVYELHHAYHLIALKAEHRHDRNVKNMVDCRDVVHDGAEVLKFAECICENYFLRLQHLACDPAIDWQQLPSAWLQLAL
jgi:hypothetical protein